MAHKICDNCHDGLDKKIEKKEKNKKSRDFENKINIEDKIKKETETLQKEFEELQNNKNNTKNNAKNIIQNIEIGSYGETEEIFEDKGENIKDIKNTNNNNKKNKNKNKSIYDIKDSTCSVTCKYSNYFIFGSGFLVKRNKVYYVITCAHIINEEQDNKNKKIYIDLQNVNDIPNNHQQIICDLVGVDSAADIAILRPLTKLENPNEGYDINDHKFIKFGDSTNTKPGKKCWIIGNTLATDPFSISNGVIRDNKFVFDLQTESLLISAPTWVGNSGSPVFNNENKVIGMVSYSFRNEDDYESTLVGGSTQFMIEKISKEIIDDYDNNTKGFIGIKKYTTLSDVVLITLRQMFPEFDAGNKDKLKGLLILDLDENIKSTTEIKKLDIILEIINPMTNEKINLGCLDDQYHYSRISWFQRIGFPIQAKLLRPFDNTTYETILSVYKLPDEYDNLFGNTGANKKQVNVGLKNYTIKSLSSKVKTRDLFDFI